MSQAQRWVRRYRFPLTAFAASRLALLLVGLLTQVYVLPVADASKALSPSKHEAMNIWARWDSGWYMDLAAHGYHAATSPGGQANWAFFPAYPGMAAAIAHLSGVSAFAAMLLISNVSFLFALVFLHELARVEFDRKTADRAVVLISVAPGSYIFSSAYPESLFCMAVTAALLMLRREKWLAAGAWAALAVLTRNLGLGLLAPFAWAGGMKLWSLWRGRGSGSSAPGFVREAARVALGALLPLAAFAGLCWLLQVKTGDPLAFLHIQQAWGRNIGLPFAAPLRALLHLTSVTDADLISLAASWICLALLAALALTRRWLLFWPALVMTLVPLSAGLSSFARYALVITPLWLVAAWLLRRRPAACLATIVFMATLDGFMMVAWTLSLWVTA